MNTRKFAVEIRLSRVRSVEGKSSISMSAHEDFIVRGARNSDSEISGVARQRELRFHFQQYAVESPAGQPIARVPEGFIV